MEQHQKKFIIPTIGKDNTIGQLNDIVRLLGNNGLDDTAAAWYRFAVSYLNRDNSIIYNKYGKEFWRNNILETFQSSLRIGKKNIKHTALNPDFAIQQASYKTFYDELLLNVEKESEAYFDSLNKSNLKSDSIINEQESKLVPDSLIDQHSINLIESIKTTYDPKERVAKITYSAEEITQLINNLSQNLASDNEFFSLQSSKINDILAIVKQNQEYIKGVMGNQEELNQNLSSLTNDVEENATRLELATVDIEELRRSEAIHEELIIAIYQGLDNNRSSMRATNESELSLLNQENQHYGEYCRSFQYILLNYINAYRSASTDLFTQNLESVRSDAENIGSTVVKFALSAFGTAPGGGLVSNVGNFLLLLYENYSMNEYINRVNIINRLLLNNDLNSFVTNEDIELNAQMVAIKFTKIRKNKIIDFIDNKDAAETGRLKKGIKWLNDKFVAPVREYMEGAREERYNTKAEELASIDALVLLASLFKNSEALEQYDTLWGKLLHLATHIDRTDGIIEMIGMIGAVSEEKDMALSEKNMALSEKDAKHAEEIALLKAQLQQNQYKDQNLDHVESPSFSKCLSCLFLPFHYFGRLMGLGGSKAKSKHDDTSKINIKTTEDVVDNPLNDKSSTASTAIRNPDKSEQSYSDDIYETTDVMGNNPLSPQLE